MKMILVISKAQLLINTSVSVIPGICTISLNITNRVFFCLMYIYYSKSINQSQVIFKEEKIKNSLTFVLKYGKFSENFHRK